MIGVSALLHLLAVASVLLMPSVFPTEPEPVRSYTVDLVSPSKVGGTNLPGKRKAAKVPVPQPIAPPVAPKVEPKPEPAVAKAEVPPPPAPPKAEPQQEAKPEPPPPPPPKPEAKKPEPPKPEAKKPEPAKPEPKKAEPPKDAVALKKDQKAPPPKKEEAKKKPEPESKETKSKDAKKKDDPKKEPPKETAKKPEPKDAKDPKAVAKAEPSAKPAPTAVPEVSEKEAKETREKIAAQLRESQIQEAINRAKSQAGGESPDFGGASSGPLSIGPAEGPGGVQRSAEAILYEMTLFARAKQNWVWPGAEKNLQVELKFGIADNGEVLDVQVTKSSGDANYDASAVRAIKGLSPLPPPPESVREQFREVILTFVPEANS